MYSQCLLFLFNAQFTLVSVRKFTNFEINMTGEFLLFKKNTAIKSYSMRGLKELKGLSEDVYKFVKKTTCQILFQINSQS